MPAHFSHRHKRRRTTTSCTCHQIRAVSARPPLTSQPAFVTRVQTRISVRRTTGVILARRWSSMRVATVSVGPVDSRDVIPIRHNCTGSPCSQDLRTGSGPFNLLRWYYDQERLQCLPFNYLGLLGSGNNFLSRETCQSACNGNHNIVFKCIHDLCSSNGAGRHMFDAGVDR
jgi:hypothetical protein